MPEEIEETRELQETNNEVSTPEELEAITAQLEEEKKAKAAAEAALAEKDARIAELQAEGEALRAERSNLQASLSEARQGSEAAAAELASIKEAKDQAVAKYLSMAEAFNPAVPEGIIAGETIEEIDASVEKGRAIVESVKKAMEAEASRAKVPAGAPARGEISLEGLSPREKIATGIQQKGGTS
jgi:chromosome segregation ATPase